MKNAARVYLFILLLVTTLVQAQQPNMIPLESVSIEGKAAPAFDLEKLGGGRVSLANLKGKVVILSFWASWCGPCRNEMPHLEKEYAQLKAKGVEIIGINVDRDSADATRWLSGVPVSFPIVLDPQAKILGAYGVESMPTSFVIDRKGVVRKKTIGYKAEYVDEMLKLISGL